MIRPIAFHVATGGLLAVLLAGCLPTTAPPEVTSLEVREEAVIQQQIVRQAAATERGRPRLARGHADVSLRANSIHRRLMQANVDDCDKWATDIGALVANRNTFEFKLLSDDRIYNPNWTRLYPTDETMRVLEVQQGTPADWAGLKVDDVITHVNGMPVGTGRQADSRYHRAIQGTDTKLLGVSRNGVEHLVQVQPEIICHMPLVLLNQDDINAYADGEAIYLYAGLEDAVQDDNQLAIILGHEMAHNTLDHVESKIANSVLGAIIAGVIDPSYADIGQSIGALAYSQEFESEADYVGVYFAARAGFDVSQAADLWRRMATINPEAIHVPSLTHPSTAMRYNTIRKTSQEISLKRNLGLPLRYELQSF